MDPEAPALDHISLTAAARTPDSWEVWRQLFERQALNRTAIGVIKQMISRTGMHHSHAYEMSGMRGGADPFGLSGVGVYETSDADWAQAVALTHNDIHSSHVHGMLGGADPLGLSGVVTDETSEANRTQVTFLTHNDIHSYRVFLDSLEKDALSVDEGKKARIKQDISALLETAGQPDWDGADALALAPQTVTLAHCLLDRFPASAFSLPDPDVSATPHGEIDFDWMPARHVMLTVGVCPSGEITFAGTFHGTQLSGKEPWRASDPLPFFIEACLKKLSQ